MSKRSKRRKGAHRGGGEDAAETGRAREAPEAAGGGPPGEGRQAGRGGARSRPAEGVTSRSAASDWSLAVQLAFLVAVFALVVLIAEVAGAANLGVALGVGQIAFAIAVVYLLVRR